MFNIVKRRDFMLAEDLPTQQEAEQLCLEKYDRDYVVVRRTDAERPNRLLDIPDPHGRAD